MNTYPQGARDSPALVPPIEEMVLSAITEGQIRRGITRLAEGKKRLHLDAFLECQLNTCARNFPPINADIVKAWGEMVA